MVVAATAVVFTCMILRANVQDVVQDDDVIQSDDADFLCYSYDQCYNVYCSHLRGVCENRNGACACYRVPTATDDASDLTVSSATAPQTSPPVNLLGMTPLAEVKVYGECRTGNGVTCGYSNVSNGAAPDFVPAGYILKGDEACVCPEVPGLECRNVYVPRKDGAIEFQCLLYSQPPPATTTGTIATTGAVTPPLTDSGLIQSGTPPLEETTMQPEPDQTTAPPEPDTLTAAAVTAIEPIVTKAPPEDVTPEEITTTAKPVARPPFDLTIPCGDGKPGALCGLVADYGKQDENAIADFFGLIPPVYGQQFCGCQPDEKCTYGRQAWFCKVPTSTEKPLPNCALDQICGQADEAITSFYQLPIKGVTKLQQDNPYTAARCLCVEMQECLFDHKTNGSSLILFACMDKLQTTTADDVIYDDEAALKKGSGRQSPRPPFNTICRFLITCFILSASL